MSNLQNLRLIRFFAFNTIKVEITFTILTQKIICFTKTESYLCNEMALIFRQKKENVRCYIICRD